MSLRTSLRIFHLPFGSLMLWKIWNMSFSVKMYLVSINLPYLAEIYSTVPVWRFRFATAETRKKTVYVALLSRTWVMGLHIVFSWWPRYILGTVVLEMNPASSRSFYFDLWMWNLLIFERKKTGLVLSHDGSGLGTFYFAVLIGYSALLKAMFFIYLLQYPQDQLALQREAGVYIHKQTKLLVKPDNNYARTCRAWVNQ